MGLRSVQFNAPVPLKSADTDVLIKGYIANVTSVLVYKNAEDKNIEIIYKFPMNNRSAVYRFEAEVEGRVIIAECQEKKLAEMTYKEAVDNGHEAAIIEESKHVSDVFIIKVGNVPPGGEIKITLGYVIELSLLIESGVARFTLHTLLNPRYNPKPESGGVLDPPTVPYFDGARQPYDFSFKAKVGDSGPLSNIVSVKDELKVEYNTDKTEACVSLSKPFIADHNLSLDISFSDPFKPHVIIEKGVATEEGLLKEDLVMLNFFPELKESDYATNLECIVIIDRSGSMDGSRIESAKETLLLFLKSLPMGCYFNIYGFGSHFDKLFPEGSKELSEESLEAALDNQKNLDAEFGCTRILKPLQDIYSKPAMSTHSRKLFILTDGQVYNTNAVIDVVNENSSHTKVFTFGIGEGASTALVNGMAWAGRGRAEYIKEGDRMQAIVMRSFKAAMQLSVTDLHLDWQLEGSPTLIQIPKNLPILFSGHRLIVYAVSIGQAALNGTVHLKGKIDERELDFGLDVHSGQVKSSEDGTLPLHRLAAKSQIQQLQIEETRESVGIKESIILLSTATNIISRYTAMVAVDKEKSAKLTGHRIVREVPHLKDPDIWISGGQIRRRLRGGCAQPQPGKTVLDFDCYKPSICNADDIFRRIRPIVSDADAMEVENEVKVTGHLEVVKLQTFCGLWKLDADLEKVLEMNLEKMKSYKPQNISDEVWGTVLALAVLNVKYSDNKDEWEMIEMKAQQWLNTQLPHSLVVTSLMAIAKAVVASCCQSQQSAADE